MLFTANCAWISVGSSNSTPSDADAPTEPSTETPEGDDETYPPADAEADTPTPAKKEEGSDETYPSTEDEAETSTPAYGGCRRRMRH